jgi:hypothetical protein
VGILRFEWGAVEELSWEVQEKGTTITHAYVKI